MWRCLIRRVSRSSTSCLKDSTCCHWCCCELAHWLYWLPSAAKPCRRLFQCELWVHTAALAVWPSNVCFSCCRHENEEVELCAGRLQETPWVAPCTLFHGVRHRRRPLGFCLRRSLPWRLSASFQSPVDVLGGMAEVEVEPLPRAVVQAFSANFDRSDARPADVPEADLSAVDGSLTCSLMPFQREGVK